MSLDPRVTPDWQIAAAAESRMKTVHELGAALGLEPAEVLPHGHHLGKVDATAVLRRLDGAPAGRYIDVTGITPTPLGEGKSTTVIGLVQGLGRLGKRVTAAIRQPSGGPTMNIKGSAAGGGLAQCIPLTPFSLGLTGDINAVTNAHNLTMVALTARMQHEANLGDKFLAARGLKRLNIDPRSATMGFVMDFCAQALRHVVIGLGGKLDGVVMESRFDIAVSSEIMAILAVARDLADLRARMGRIVVAHDRRGGPITTHDLGVAGAATAWLLTAFQPNLLQTLEGQPVFVHAGPFANIALGQSSILADLLGVRLADYHVTESGFGADIGFEKFWNLKCRLSGLRPHCAVLVVTVRALKCHGGGPAVRPGRPLDPEYTREHVDWVERGAENLVHHIRTVQLAGVAPVVCINVFPGDTPAELAAVRQAAEAAGARAATAEHWQYGGAGAEELAAAVLEACEEPQHFRFLYDLDEPHRARIERIARQVYGAAGVRYEPQAEEKLAAIDADPEALRFGTCMAKTHLSLSDDPHRKGVPSGWTLAIRDVLTYRGAGLVVPVAGDISLMPGTAANPAFQRIDVDVETGQVTGLF